MSHNSSHWYASCKDIILFSFKIILNSIENSKANLTLEYIQEAITPATANQGVTQVDADTGEVSGDETGVEDNLENESGNLTWLWILIAVAVVAGAIVLGIKKKRLVSK